MARSPGFTLVELVLVLVILGVLAAVAVPQLTDTGDTAALTAARTQAKAISAADAANVANCRLNRDGDDCTALDFNYCSDLDGADGALAELLPAYDPDRFDVAFPRSSGPGCKRPDTEFYFTLTATADGVGSPTACCLGATD
ncbi:MAG: prepilin-type N-terminal cleavage/methylation domain-containing protein [Thiohalospira sp.]